ncbi:MAG: hypothetical protein M3380_06935, partial [Chloroflexota bacterium]|nr:hypothetical protein [Chloroflexota bacterium]
VHGTAVNGFGERIERILGSIASHGEAITSRYSRSGRTGGIVQRGDTQWQNAQNNTFATGPKRV